MLSDEKFQAELDRCMAEVTRHLPAIAEKHSSLALLVALTEHVGGALQLFMQQGTFTEEQARAVLARVEETAFERPGKAEKPPAPTGGNPPTR